MYEFLFYLVVSIFLGSEIYNEYKKKLLKKVAGTRFGLLEKFFDMIKKYKDVYSNGKITKDQIKELNNKMFVFTDEAKKVF